MWVVLFAAALSGFFALSSYSLRAFRRSQLEDLLADHPGKARLASLDRHLSALRLNTSLCRTAANVVLIVAMLGLFDAFKGRPVRLAAAMGVTMAIIAIFGVAVPHAWASCAGERILAVILPILLALRYALYPVTRAMAALDVPVRRLAGISETRNENGEAAKQEILQAASEGQAEGAVEPEEVEMIESVMEFGDTQAAEIMTPRTDIFALPVDTPWQEAVGKLVAAGHTRVPVYQGDIDNIIGILYAKDMLCPVEKSAPAPLDDLLRKPFFVPETKALNDLLREFKARKVHIAVVLDEYGGTAGIITIEDVLEEIVGDISDEYDRAEPAPMNRIDAATIEVDGRMYIDDLNDALKLEIPEDADYDTVAGLMFSELGYIPAINETLRAFGVEFTVLDADERKITRLRVRILDKKKRNRTTRRL